jgi:hypothetical protein
VTDQEIRAKAVELATEMAEKTNVPDDHFWDLVWTCEARIRDGGEAK